MELALIPLQKNSQIPIKGCTWRDENISDLKDQINEDNNIGLVLGQQSGIVALDFDYDIDDLHNKILKIAGKSPIAKKGAKGFTMFYRWDGERKKQYSIDGEVILDVLGEGTYTVLPPSIHPKTMQPYIWLSEKTLEDVGLNELPFLPTDLEDQLDVLFGKGEVKTEKRTIDEDIIEALKYLNNPPNEFDYDTWLSVGMALKSEFGDEGLPLWQNVSSKSSKSTGKSIPSKWESFKDGGITIATIYKLAILNGYRPDDTLYTVSRAKKKLDKWKKEGYPVGEQVGIPELDELWHLRKKEFTVITGKPNSGKSEFLDYLIYNAAINCNYNTFYCSFEKDPIKHIEAHIHRYVGKTLEERTKEEDKEAEKFVSDHFYFYNHAYNSNKIENILKKIKELTNKIQIDIIVIDPFSYLESDYGSAENNMDHVKKTCILLSKYAKMLDVHIFLVAHPKSFDDKKRWDREKKKYVPAAMSLYSISGGATFYNKCDNGIIISRQDESTEVNFSKIREQEYDKPGNFLMSYDTKKRRYKPYLTKF